MNMFKSNGGFTLVELIVVIAILAILAGVAVPAYSGYINNANKASDDQKLEAVETAMIAALGMNGKDATDADDCFDISKDNDNNFTFVIDATNAAQESVQKIVEDFNDFYGATPTVALKYYSDVEFVDGAVKGK